MNVLDREILVALEERLDNKCFFCQSPQSYVVDTPAFDGKKYHCDICGDYSVVGTVLATTNKYSFDFGKLSAVAAEMKLKKCDGYKIAAYSDPVNKIFSCQTFSHMFPIDFMDLLDRSLWNIARLTQFSPLENYSFVNNAYFYTFSNDLVQSGKILNCLRQRGDIDFEKITDIGIPKVHLTLQGYERIRKLQLGQGQDTIAFVAMSFESSKRMEKFRRAVRDAIELAGYKCKIVDMHEHNNFIMDEVVNLINSAKFVIADFTSLPEKITAKGRVTRGVRGGVYFEAGYARGKGKEVICTCYNDSASNARRHFDILQINTIFWTQKNESELVKKLYNRIIQSEKIGYGPLIVPQELKDKYKGVFI